MYDEVRIVVEIASAIICFILVWFMIKPYQLTREGRYLGLPLGFMFLGISYTFAAIAFSTYARPFFFTQEISWLQLLTRSFAFVFLAVTYYFSKKFAQKNRLRWDSTLGFLVVMLVALSVIGIVVPQFTYESYQAAQVYVRIFNVFCLAYIAIHTLRSHIQMPDPTTIWIPIGFILLAVSQYSLLFWYIDSSLSAFMGALVIRLLGLSVFLFVSYRTFYGKDKRRTK